MDILVWAIVFVVFVVAEVCTVQLVSIWFAAGALVALLCTYFIHGLPVVIQLIIFIVVSGVSLAITIPMMRKKLKTPKISTNSELDVGQNAIVIEEINLSLGTGRVTLNGVDWSAVPEVANAVIPKGSIVVIRKVNGAKLTVAAKDNAEQ